MTKEQRKAKTLRDRKYRADLRKDTKRLEEHHAKERMRMREWRANKAKDPVWLAAHRAKERARVKAYYDAHPEKRREQWLKFTAKSGIARRPKERVRHAVKVVLAGRLYKPRFYMRKPDYVPVGASGVDTRSTFLWNNLTDSQRGYAMELAIERKERRAMA